MVPTLSFACSSYTRRNSDLGNNRNHYLKPLENLLIFHYMKIFSPRNRYKNLGENLSFNLVSMLMFQIPDAWVRYCTRTYHGKVRRNSKKKKKTSFYDNIKFFQIFPLQTIWWEFMVIILDSSFLKGSGWDRTWIHSTNKRIPTCRWQWANRRTWACSPHTGHLRMPRPPHPHQDLDRSRREWWPICRALPT